MSYSRWLGSRWFTYWLASNETRAKLQVLCIQGVAEFNVTELRTRPKECLAKTIKIEQDTTKKPVTESESNELLAIFDRFLDDVRRRYSGG